MNYEINVSLNGKHFFATSNRSITDQNKLKEVYKELKNHFTKEKGFDITIQVVKQVSSNISIVNGELSNG